MSSKYCHIQLQTQVDQTLSLNRLMRYLYFFLLPPCIVVVLLAAMVGIVGWPKVEHAIRPYVGPNGAEVGSSIEATDRERELLRRAQLRSGAEQPRDDAPYWRMFTGDIQDPASRLSSHDARFEYVLMSSERGTTPVELSPMAADSLRVYLLRGDSIFRYTGHRRLGIAILENDQGYILELRTDRFPRPQMIATAWKVDRHRSPQTNNSSSQSQENAKENSLARFHLVAAEDRVYVPLGYPFDNIRFTRVNLRESSIAAAFVAFVRQENDRLGASEELLPLDEKSAVMLERLLTDLLLVGTGRLQRHAGGNDAALANASVLGYADQVAWKVRLLGSDWWGLIQFTCYVFLMFICLGALASWRRWRFAGWRLNRWRPFILDQIPQIAFVGTVAGISMAILDAYLVTSPDRLVKDLAISDITSHMGTAMNTTLIGLITFLIGSMVLALVAKSETIQQTTLKPRAARILLVRDPQSQVPWLVSQNVEGVRDAAKDGHLVHASQLRSEMPEFDVVIVLGTVDDPEWTQAIARYRTERKRLQNGYFAVRYRDSLGQVKDNDTAATLAAIRSDAIRPAGALWYVGSNGNEAPTASEPLVSLIVKLNEETEQHEIVADIEGEDPEAYELRMWWSYHRPRTLDAMTIVPSRTLGKDVSEWERDGSQWKFSRLESRLQLQDETPHILIQLWTSENTSDNADAKPVSGFVLLEQQQTSGS